MINAATAMLRVFMMTSSPDQLLACAPEGPSTR